MDIVNRIVQASDARRQRLHAALAMAVSLPVEEREELLAELVRQALGRNGAGPDGAIAPRRVTLRDAIRTVLSDRKPRGVAEIHSALRAHVPGVHKGSVAGEVGRMRKAGLLASSPGARGRLYSLAPSSGAISSAPSVGA